MIIFEFNWFLTELQLNSTKNTRDSIMADKDQNKDLNEEEAKDVPEA